MFLTQNQSSRALTALILVFFLQSPEKLEGCAKSLEDLGFRKPKPEHHEIQVGADTHISKWSIRRKVRQILETDRQLSCRLNPPVEVEALYQGKLSLKEIMENEYTRVLTKRLRIKAENKHSIDFPESTTHSLKEAMSAGSVLISPLLGEEDWLLRYQRLLLLDLIHIADDVVDTIQNKKYIKLEDFSLEDISQYFPLLQSYVIEVLNVGRDRLSDSAFRLQSNDLHYGLWRTYVGNLLFEPEIDSELKEEYREAYRTSIVNRLRLFEYEGEQKTPITAEVIKLFEELPNRYVGLTHKVLLETFNMVNQRDEPFKEIDELRALSYLQELLFVPALTNLNLDLELEEREISDEAKLPFETLQKALTRVGEVILELPQQQREFAMHHFPIFLKTFEPVLKETKGENTSLYEVYSQIYAAHLKQEESYDSNDN